jgi:hypothetical protein
VNEVVKIPSSGPMGHLPPLGEGLIIAMRLFNMQFVVGALLGEAFLGFPLMGKLAAKQTDEVIMISLIRYFLSLRGKCEALYEAI